MKQQYKATDLQLLFQVFEFTNSIHRDGVLLLLINFIFQRFLFYERLRNLLIDIEILKWKSLKCGYPRSRQDIHQLGPYPMALE